MNTVSKTTKWIYYISTGLLAFIAIASGIINISMNETVKELCKTHGFNILIAPFFGAVKILGAIAIIIPMLKKIRGAAYMGFIYYFIGATYFNIIDGSPAYKTTIIILGLTIVSYIFCQKAHSTKLETTN